jgi:hypothetical protein
MKSLDISMHSQAGAWERGKNDNQIVVYNDGEIELKVSINNETVWLNRQQISKLFGRDVKTIGKHINNIFKDSELEKNQVVANFATTATDGKTYNVEYYNLDMIISIGYRVKSQKGVLFRQWATKVLKEYIYNGYAVNREKITQMRIANLEKDVEFIKSQIKNNTLEFKQGIFYDGQIFDAYVFVANIIKSAKSSIVLIDNFVDETVLMLLSKRASTCKATIYTKTISKQLQLDLKKHNEQYLYVEIKKFNSSHDRFLIIDENEIYHIGASLKDLGKKWFGFSKMDSESLSILGRLK